MEAVKRYLLAALLLLPAPAAVLAEELLVDRAPEEGQEQGPDGDALDRDQVDEEVAEEKEEDDGEARDEIEDRSERMAGEREDGK